MFDSATKKDAELVMALPKPVIVAGDICVEFWHKPPRLGKKVIILFPKQALVFTCLQCKTFEHTMEKGEIAHYEQFLLFP